MVYTPSELSLVLVQQKCWVRGRDLRRRPRDRIECRVKAGWVGRGGGIRRIIGRGHGGRYRSLGSGDKKHVAGTVRRPDFIGSGNEVASALAWCLKTL